MVQDMISRSQDTAEPVQLLHLWDKHVTNARTGETIFTLSKALRQTRFISFKPVLVVSHVFSSEPICTIRVGRLRESAIRVTTPEREIKISSVGMARRKWEFTPTTTAAKQSWVWQSDETGVLPSVVLKDAKDGGQTLARISANLLSFQTMDLTVDTWKEIVLTAVALAEHVRCQRRHGGALDVSGGIMTSSDGGSGGDGGGSCGGDGGSGGGGGGDGGGCS